MNAGPNTRPRRAKRLATSGSRPAAARMSKALSSRILRVAVMTSFEPTRRIVDAIRAPLTSSLDQPVSIVQFLPGSAGVERTDGRRHSGRLWGPFCRMRFGAAGILLYSGSSDVDLREEEPPWQGSRARSLIAGSASPTGMSARFGLTNSPSKTRKTDLRLLPAVTIHSRV